MGMTTTICITLMLIGAVMAGTAVWAKWGRGEDGESHLCRHV